MRWRRSRRSHSIRRREGGDPMLERLDEMKWGVPESARGPAECVPETMRNLLDPDPRVRDAVGRELRDNERG